MLKQAFSNDIYIEKQTHEIMQRIKRFDGKLYLEFGGKLFDDFHASRVLPGFKPDTKIKLLQSLADQAEIIFCISADDIEKTKVRADLGISYDMDVLRLIDEFKAMGLSIYEADTAAFAEHILAQYVEKKSETWDMDLYAKLQG